MKYLLICKIISIVTIVGILSGCTGFGTETETQQVEDIIFESDVMQLAEAKINEIKGSHNTCIGVEVQFRMRNPLENQIDNLEILIELCDEKGIVLDDHTFRYNSPFPAEYTEYSPVVPIQFKGLV